MVSRAYTALFNIEGNAARQVDEIRGRMQGLNSIAQSTAQRLRQVGAELTGKGFKGERAANQLGTQLLRTGTNANITSEALFRYSRAAEIASVDSTLFKARLIELSAELKNTATSVLATEQSMQANSRRMVFMGDVSAGAARGVRGLSSAAQGSLLGLALMEKNILGVAFSLIFLQFSGAIKLSLALAALTIIGKLAFDQVSKLFATSKEAKKLSDQFFILTRNTKAFELATSRAKDIVAGLGLTGKNAEEFQKAITGALLEIEKIGKGDPAKNIEIFAKAFLALKPGTEFDEAFSGALDTMKGFIEEGEAGLDGFRSSFEELDSRAGAALIALSSTGIVSIEDLVAAFADAEVEIPRHIQKALDDAETEFIDLKTLFPLLQVGLEKDAAEEIADIFRGMTENNATNLENASDRIIASFETEEKSAKNTASEIQRSRERLSSDLMGFAKDNTDNMIEESKRGTEESKSLFKTFGESVGSTFDGLKNAAKGFWNMLGDVLNRLKDFFKDLGGKAADFFGLGDDNSSNSSSSSLPSGLLPNSFQGLSSTNGNTQGTILTINVDVHGNNVDSPDELASSVATRIFETLQTQGNNISLSRSNLG